MAMEVLYRWTQLYCKDIESTATGPLLVFAMEVLQDRPVLFKYVFLTTFFFIQIQKKKKNNVFKSFTDMF